MPSRLNRRVLDRHGRTDDGKVWLSYRLSKAASTYAVITVPAALKKVVHGRFQLLDRRRPRDRHAGHQGRPGLGPGRVPPPAGARIGDHIILTLDLENRTAVVSWDEKGEEKELRPL